MACETAEHAKMLTHEQHKQLLRDLNHIPDDKLDWVPMGKAKTAKQIIVECAGAYRWLAAKIRGDENADGQWGEVFAMAPPTREETAKLLEECWGQLAPVLDGVEEGELGEKRQAFWGETTVGDLLFFCEWHSTYHSGQLNYIQTMLGDTEMHMQ